MLLIFMTMKYSAWGSPELNAGGSNPRCNNTLLEYPLVLGLYLLWLMFPGLPYAGAQLVLCTFNSE